MPEITADKIIGKTLFAKRDLDILNSSLQKIGVLPKGNSIVVDSYIQRNGNVYWQFVYLDRFRYVKHTADSFSFKGDVEKAIEQKKKEEEQQKIQEQIDQKGKVFYYVEKYGKWVLGTIIVLTIVREYIRKKA